MDAKNTKKLVDCWFGKVGEMVSGSGESAWEIVIYFLVIL